MASDGCFQRKTQSSRIALVWAVVLSLLLAACGGATQPKTYTIGVIVNNSLFIPLIEGFEAGMAELGYVEGENVTYIIDSSFMGSDPDVIEGEVESLLAQDVDMLVTVGTAATLAAKQAVAGTDVPIVFGAVTNPVGKGIVESISHPGGNLTGTQVGTEIPKALEWLVTVVPETRKVYVPYNPDEEVWIAVLGILDEASSQLGVELVLDKVYSVEEAVAAIESLPEDVDAIFRIPSGTLDSRNDELSQAAIERGIPMVASLPLDEAVLLTLAADFFDTGRQTARLAHQIRQGARPADLPVETVEFSLIINLKTAEAIGLDIPDEILLQADTIIH